MIAYGWVTKTQKRISRALVSDRLTKWEMQFLQTIDDKLQQFQTDSKLSESQHQRLFLILSSVEKSKDKIGFARDKRSVKSTDLLYKRKPNSIDSQIFDNELRGHHFYAAECKGDRNLQQSRPSSSAENKLVDKRTPTPPLGGSPQQTNPIILRAAEYGSVPSKRATPFQDRPLRLLVQRPKINPELIKRAWELMQEKSAEADGSIAPSID